MKALMSWVNRLIEVTIVLLLAGMALMVFVNVVLRYGVNSGIVISEEMSRFFFVWLTFIGAVAAFKENSHLGVETLVRRFNRRGRVICMGLSNLLALLCLGVLFWGTYMQAPINATMRSTVSGMPMILVYGVTFFTAIGMGLIAVYRLVLIVTGRISDAEIAEFVGDYDDVEALVGRGE